jgi:hypothetical protein
MKLIKLPTYMGEFLLHGMTTYILEKIIDT